MIRSSKITLKYSNTHRKKEINIFIDEYVRVTQIFVNILWEMEKIPYLLPKDITSKNTKLDTWLSARVLQCSGKQASGIVRGTREKQKKRLFQIKTFEKEGKHKKARKLQAIYNKTKVSKPVLKNVNPELDSRFIKMDWNSKTSFDGWINISSLGNKMSINIPLKKNMHFNKFLSKGKLQNGIRLSKDEITFMFEIDTPLFKIDGEVLGIDVGKTTTISCSNGYVSKPNKHNHDLNSISKIMSRKKKGSKGFERCVAHRENYINWSINQLNLNTIKQINIENIKNLRKGKRTNRIMSHWTYTNIFDKLERTCEEQGVLVNKLSPVYTSQRCNKCGWVRKSNRKKKSFKCDVCGLTMDADLNASLNLALNLPPITKEERLQHSKKIGFYWNVVCQELIVPDALKA